MSQDNLSICFYFPYLEDSGVPVLFSRMANSIANTYPAIDVSVIDYMNGAVGRNLKVLSNLKLIVFIEGIPVSPPENSILIMQSLLPYYWPKELILHAKTRLFFWNLHPKNFIPSLLPLPGLRDMPVRRQVHLDKC